MRKHIWLTLAFVAVAFVSGWFGYYVADKRGVYRSCRWSIQSGTVSNAKLDASYYDRIYRDNDVQIVGNYQGVQTLPKWLLPFFTFGQKQSSDKRVAQMVNSIEVALKRSNIQDDRDKIETVVRRWLAWHR